MGDFTTKTEVEMVFIWCLGHDSSSRIGVLDRHLHNNLPRSTGSK